MPVYQRPYSWDKEQVDVLLEDLHQTYKEDKNSGYYIEILSFMTIMKK